MLRATILGIAVFLFAGGALAQDEDLPRISVSGTGTVSAAPDMAVVSLGARADAGTAREALARTSQAVAATLEVLADAGISPADIQTQGVQITPRWTRQQNVSDQPPRIVGYIASNTLRVRVRDLERLGGVLDAAVESGANTIGGIRFTLEDSDAAMADARRAAVEDGMAKASLLAEAAGVTLGRLLLLTEGGGATPQGMVMREAMMADAAVPVAPGEVDFSARVTMIYEIID